MNIDFVNKIYNQIQSCRKKHGDYASFKESLAILFEEVQELWEESRKHELDFNKIEAEIIDCATVLFKMQEDIVLKRNNK